MAETDPRIIGARIAKRRQQLDMTQTELAARIGVSRETVAKWENGTHYPKRKLGKVEQVLGITLDYDDKPEPQPARPVTTDDYRERMADLFDEAVRYEARKRQSETDTNMEVATHARRRRVV